MERDEAMARVRSFLVRLGFRIASTGPDFAEAVRGRKTANTRKIRQLPQTVKVVYDRNRVTVAASITPRAGRDLPLHTDMMLAVVTGLERLLIQRESVDAAAAEWDVLEASDTSVRTTVDRLGVGCLIGLVAVLILVALIILVAALS